MQTPNPYRYPIGKRRMQPLVSFLWSIWFIWSIYCLALFHFFNIFSLFCKKLHKSILVQLLVQINTLEKRRITQWVPSTEWTEVFNKLFIINLGPLFSSKDCKLGLNQAHISSYVNQATSNGDYIINMQKIGTPSKGSVIPNHWSHTEQPMVALSIYQISMTKITYQSDFMNFDLYYCNLTALIDWLFLLFPCWLAAYNNLLCREYLFLLLLWQHSVFKLS
jgi:hypothetical protein